MKIKVILSLSLLFINTLIITAQAPGYLGKKTVFSLGTGLRLTLGGPTANNKGLNSFGGEETQNNGIGIEHSYKADFLFVTSRKGGINIKGGRYKTGVISSARTTALDGGFDDHQLLHQLNVSTFEISYVFFKAKKGAIAPLGNQFHLGYKINWINGEIVDKYTDYADSINGPIDGHTPIAIEHSTRTRYLTLGWMTSRIFYDKLVFRAGIVGALRFASNAYSVGLEPISNQGKYEVNAQARIDQYELVRLELGIGYLLF